MLDGKLAFGDEPPLVADRGRRPDRRQVSLRWLAGTLLTGVVSTALMGIALSAALDGHQGAALPSQAALRTAATPADPGAKAGRVVATALPLARSRQIVELSTIVREGERDVITTRPFGFVNMLLAARHQTSENYPRFDPLAMMTGEAEEDEETGAGDSAADTPLLSTSQIYGARVESDIALTMTDFVFDESTYERSLPPMTAADAERTVRQVMPNLAYQPVQVASLSSVDPFRFGFAAEPQEYEPGSAFRVVEENVSLASADPAHAHASFHEEIVPVLRDLTVSDALAPIAERGVDAAEAATALAAALDDKPLKPDDALRIGIETVGETSTVVRLSAYRGETHLSTVAETEEGAFAPAFAPEMAESVEAVFDERASEAPMRADMPSIYDGIYQAALAYGLSKKMCAELTRMLAADVDLQSRLSPTDRLAVFYSLDPKTEGEETPAEILSVTVKLGDSVRTFYRFRPADADSASYFDAEGRSARQFLLRKPVPTGRFTSAFSTGRKHPVLGYVRPHWGVDWAAPRGTPILAAADGTVTEAGWRSGYGRHTEIRHANGYVTSYSHQSGLAKGIRPNAKVRQGQIIGYIGSTGLSTGNHLHYEVEVNGKKVDPMRIKVGSGQVLQGEDLSAFLAERDRIDALVKERFDAPLVASR